MLWNLILVEQMGVEPTTYTMRTYRSSQLSYCPLFRLLYNIIPFFKIANHFCNFFLIIVCSIAFLLKAFFSQFPCRLFYIQSCILYIDK